MTWREINKAVMERYPVTDRERGCASEKRKRDELRALARQRIENEFTVPNAASKIFIKLKNSGTDDVFFDDVRVFPKHGEMKSFVYDPVTLRFVAELDENNYATFYEYDEQGNLVRIKKETERGIMTINENRISLPKE